MCQCGCRGWCTLYPLLLVWAQDLSKLQDQRSAPFAVLDICGDWPAFLQIFGLRYWSHKTHPCPMCLASQSEMTSNQTLHGITSTEFPFHIYTNEEYMEDIRARKKASRLMCGISLGLFCNCPPNFCWPCSSHPCAQSRVFTLLQYNKTRRGRALIQPVPELGLCKGHRLMPAPDLRDVAEFESKQPPFYATFWIGGVDDRVVHDNPLLLVKGLGLHTFSIDLMHTWHLGPMQQLVSMSLHCFLDAGILNPNTLFLNAQDQKKVGLMAIKAELFQWYKEQRKDPEWLAKGTEETRRNL